jgi:hypothetical protein
MVAGACRRSLPDDPWTRRSPDPVEQLVPGLDPAPVVCSTHREKALHIPVIVGQHGDGIHVGRSSVVGGGAASLTADRDGWYNDRSQDHNGG